MDKHTHGEHEHGEHGHGGHMGHSHAHADTEIMGVRLLIVTLLNFLITAAEIVGGLVSGSLSLLSDALHNASDTVAVILSWYAVRLSGKKNDYKKTFGYRRASIMAALINASVLVGISGFLFKEAWDKFFNPVQVNGLLVTWVALLGLAANFTCMLLLRKGSHGDLNIKSAYIHLLSDALSSVGVVVAGVLIMLFKVYWVDPLLTVLIGLYILVECAGIIKEAVNILMQGAPDGFDVNAVVAELVQTGGVESVHHVHVWSLDEKNIHFEAHVDVADIPVSGTAAISERFEKLLREEHGITHVTLQFECGRCRSCGAVGEACE